VNEPAGWDAVLRNVSGRGGGAAPTGTVVFDLDGTLVRGDCGDALIRHLLSRHWLRRLAALLALPLGLPMMAFPPLRRRGVSIFLWLGTVGLDDKELSRRIDAFLLAYPYRPITGANLALDAELAAGHHVVIATGALNVLAEHLVGRMGFAGRVAVVASAMAPFAGGQVTRVQCNGRVKLEELGRAGFAPPYLRAYSDSWTDHPLLAAARTAIAVNCRDRDLARLQRKFGDRLQVMPRDATSVQVDAGSSP